MTKYTIATSDQMGNFRAKKGGAGSNGCHTSGAEVETGVIGRDRFFPTVHDCIQSIITAGSPSPMSTMTREAYW